MRRSGCPDLRGECYRFRCRFSCRLTPTLSGIPKVELRQITPSVNDLLISCRTSYSPAVAKWGDISDLITDRKPPAKFQPKTTKTHIS